MINSANSLHILHRASTAELSQQLQSSGDDESNASEHESDDQQLCASHGSPSSQAQSPDNDDEEPLLTSLLLPRGLEYEEASCDRSSKTGESDTAGRADENVVGSRLFSSNECKLSFFSLRRATVLPCIGSHTQKVTPHISMKIDPNGRMPPSMMMTRGSMNQRFSGMGRGTALILEQLRDVENSILVL